MWSLVQHQLENARLLATHDKRRPRQASLRRAVSTAYYAVFQALCATCADTLVKGHGPWEIYTPVFRTPDHYRTAQTLLQGSEVRSELQRLGSAFKELLAAREWADYSPEPRPNFEDGSPSFTREETLALIELADEAVAILDRLDEDARLKLAVRLVTRTRK
jgi:hypothetical protein